MCPDYYHLHLTMFYKTEEGLENDWLVFKKEFKINRESRIRGLAELKDQQKIKQRNVSCNKVN